MTEKYIVALKERETLYKAVVGADGEPYISPAMGNVYKEPDLDAIRNEAYEKGVQDTKQHWVDAPRTCAYQFGYENGLNDAWEAARKIASDDAGRSYSIFGQHFTVEILNTHSASECIEKIRKYEQEQKQEEKQLQVGDEVNAPFGKAVVVSIDSVAEKIWFMYETGYSGFDYFKDAPTKTGRHFPEIAAVLQKMKE